MYWWWKPKMGETHPYDREAIAALEDDRDQLVSDWLAGGTRKQGST
jgi:hypothetical protein